MLNVVIDTVVFVRCLINPKNAAGQLLLEHADAYEIHLSESIIWEVLEVITRPSIRQSLTKVAELPLQRVLDILARARVVDVAVVPAVSRDPKDDKFLAVAAAVGADYLISEDRDLLVLGSYEQVEIIDSLTFVQRLTAAR